MKPTSRNPTFQHWLFLVVEVQISDEWMLPTSGRSLVHQLSSTFPTFFPLGKGKAVRVWSLLASSG